MQNLAIRGKKQAAETFKAVLGADSQERVDQGRVRGASRLAESTDQLVAIKR